MGNGNLQLKLTIQADGTALVQASQQGAQGLKSVGAAAQDTTVKIQGVANANSNVTASFSQLGKGAAVFGVISSAASRAADMMGALPKAGFAYNAELEVSRLGMAGILTSMTAINGQQTQFVQGQQMAAQIVSRLADDAARTSANTAELVGAFQALLGPGLAAGMTIQQIERLTVAGVTAVKSLGLQQQQVVQELRDLVQGGITASSSTLATALGLKDADIAKARASAQGLFAFLMERMKGFEESSDKFADTVSGRLQALQEQATRSAATALGPFMAVVAEQAAKLTDTLKNTEGAAALDQLAAKASTVASAVGTAARIGLEYSGVLLTIGSAYGALGLAGRVNQWVDIARAKGEAANASRLAAVNAIAEGQASTAVVQSTRQEIAAKIDGMQATANATKASAAEAAAKVVSLQQRAEWIGQTRSAVQAQLEEANATNRAASAMGAQSSALAAVRQSAAQRSQSLRELGTLGQAQAAVEREISAATVASQAASSNASVAAQRLAQAKDTVSYSSRAATAAVTGFNTVVGALGGYVGIAIMALSLMIGKMAEARAEAAQAAQFELSLERVRKANADGKQADSYDVSIVQGGLNRLKKSRDDEIVGMGRLQAVGELAFNSMALAAAGAGEGIDTSLDAAAAGVESAAQKVATAEGKIADVAAVIETAGAVANKSLDGVGLNATQAGKRLQDLLADVRTASSLTKEAELKIAGINAAKAAALAPLKAQKDAAAASQKIEAESAAAIKQIRVKLGLDIKQLNEQGAADAKALAEGRYALAKALAGKTAEAQRAAIDQVGRANEAAYRMGIREAEDYYDKKSQLAQADIDLKEKELQAELKSAEAAAKKATRQEDILHASARVVEIETKLIELGRERAKVDAPEDYAVRQWEVYTRNIEKRYESAAEGADTLAKELKDLEFEGSLIGKNAAQVRELNKARAEELALRLESDARIMRDIDLSGRTSDALERQAKLIRQIADQKGRNDAAQVTAQAWEQAGRDIEQSLADSLYRGFESGSNVFKSFLNGIKNTLKTTLIKVPIQFVSSAISNTLLGSLGVGGAATAASSVNLTGLLSSGLSIGNLYQNAGGVGNALFSLQHGFGEAVDAIKYGLQDLFDLSAQTTNMVGDAIPYLGSLLSLAQGNYGSAIGSAIGTAILPGIGTVVGSFLGGLFDGGGGGPKTESGYGPGVDVRGDPTSSRAISDSIKASYQQLAATLGIAIKDLQVGVFTAIDSAGDALTQLEVSAVQDGVEIYNRQARYGANSLGSGIENVARGEEGLRAAVSEEVLQVLRAALQQSDLDQIYKDYINSATDINAAVQTVVAVSQLDKALRALGGPLASLADLSVDAQIAFANQMGGLQGLSAAINGYLENYYSEGERQELMTRQLTGAFADLGMALPGTRAELRGLIETASNSGNAELAGKLLQLQGVFSALVPAAADLTGQLEDMAEGMRTAADIANERKQLEDQLLQLQGNAAELRLRERSAIDASNLALFDQVTAQRALNEIRQQAIQIEGQRADVERQILEATIGVAAARAQELAGMDPLVAAIQASYYARLDELDAVKQQNDEATRIRGDLANVERQLLEESGGLAAVREAERAATLPANQALLESLYARQDELKAMQDAKAAQQQQLQQTQQQQQQEEALQTQLQQMLGNTAALRLKELDSMSPLAAATQQRIWMLQAEAEQLDRLKGQGSSAYAILQASVSARRSEVEAAYQAQVAVLDAQKSAQQTYNDSRVSALQGQAQGNSSIGQGLSALSSALQSAIGQLRGSAEDQAQSLLQARALVADAIQRAKDGGGLPTAESLQKALSTITGAGTDGYSTREDYIVAQASMAGQLEELQRLTGDQQTVEQQTLAAINTQISVAQTATQVYASGVDQQLAALKSQYDADLKGLDDQLDVAKQQLDAAMGQTQATLSLTEAMNYFGASVAALAAANADAIRINQEELARIAEVAGAPFPTLQVPTIPVPTLPLPGSSLVTPNVGGSSSGASGGDVADLLAQLVQIREAIESGDLAIATNTNRIAKVIESQDRYGIKVFNDDTTDPLRTREVTP